jgi:hypothetical protein
VVDRHGDALHDNDRGAQSDRGLDAFRDGEEGAHAEKERQGQVLDEHGADKQAEVIFHYYQYAMR